MSILICTIPNLYTENVYIEATEQSIEDYYANEITLEDKDLSISRLENYLLGMYLNKSSYTYYKTFKKDYLPNIKKKDITYIKFISDPELKSIRNKTEGDYNSYRKLVLRLLIPKIYRRLDEILKHQVVICASTLLSEALFLLFKQSYLYGTDILPLHYKRLDIKNKIIKRYLDFSSGRLKGDVEVLDIHTGELIQVKAKEKTFLDNVNIDKLSKLKNRYIGILPMWDLNTNYYSYYASSHKYLVNKEIAYFNKKEEGVVVKKPSIELLHSLPSLVAKTIHKDNNYDTWRLNTD